MLNLVAARASFGIVCSKLIELSPLVAGSMTGASEVNGMVPPELPSIVRVPMRAKVAMSMSFQLSTAARPFCRRSGSALLKGHPCVSKPRDFGQ